MPAHPVLPDDPVLVRLFHKGVSDKQIADEYHVSVQAVNKRLTRLGLRRKPVSRQVSEYLSVRWKVHTVPRGGTSHHNLYSARRLREWLRLRLGDDQLSDEQKHRAQVWEERLRREGLVLCYDPEREDGWYYRPRTPADGRLAIDWPEDLPFPDERFRKALEIPPEPAAQAVR
jgi:hypothetical protein